MYLQFKVFCKKIMLKIVYSEFLKIFNLDLFSNRFDSKILSYHRKYLFNIQKYILIFTNL